MNKIEDETKLFGPLHNQVIIKPIEVQESQGNIIVPDMGKEKPRIGVVVAVGPGFITMNGQIVPCTVKNGDKVAYPSFGGHVFTIQGQEYVGVKENDIITILYF